MPASITYLYRGIKPKPERYDSWNVGETMLFPTYMSTSLSPSVAWTFQGCGEKPCCIFVLVIPENKRAKLPWIYIPDHSISRARDAKSAKDNNMRRDERDMEHEVLLPRNTQWKLTKKYTARISPDSAVQCSFKKISDASDRPITVFECTFVDCVFGELHCPDSHSKKDLLSFEIHIKTPLLLEEVL
jgi:hypothetical protein